SDLKTGEYLAVLIERLEDVISEIFSVGAREIVVSGSLDADTVAQLKERCGASISIEDGETDEDVMIIEHLDKEDVTKTFLRLYTY
ncbi:hypothetical protein, partial [Bacillus spizizenii]|uniref:hypothetical protein n=1 Tax=Bacillus spizizenii TaxID=96241 RepID=UPI001F615F70